MRPFLLSERSQIEHKIMLTAAFFDSENNDFQNYVADWFEITMGMPPHRAALMAANLLSTYEQALLLDLEQVSKKS